MSIKEIQNHEWRVQTVEFADYIASRNLPIDYKDACLFAAKMLSKNPPKGFLKRVADGIEYQDECSFKSEAEQLALKAKEIIGNEPYDAYFYRFGRSGSWIYNLMLENGVPEAKGEYYIDHDLLTHPENKNVVIFDHFAVTGCQIHDILSYLSEDGFNINLFFTRITNGARGFLERKCKVTAIATIGSLHEVYSEDDFEFFDKYYRDRDLGDIAIGYHGFFSAYKVPDNIAGWYIGRDVPSLIRTNKFHPPYGK